MIDKPSIVLAFSMRMLTSFSVDEILLPRYVNCSKYHHIISKRLSPHKMWKGILSEVPKNSVLRNIFYIQTQVRKDRYYRFDL